MGDQAQSQNIERPEFESATLSEGGKLVLPVTREIHKDLRQANLKYFRGETAIYIFNNIARLAIKLDSGEISDKGKRELKDFVVASLLYLTDMESQTKIRVKSGEMTEEDGVIADNFTRKLSRQNIDIKIA